MKITKVLEEQLEFDNGTVLTSYHDQDCCEEHYVEFTSIIGQGWEGKDFPETLVDMVVKKPKEKTFFDDVDNEKWNSFVEIKDKQGNKYTLTIYNKNNGYYAIDVTLVLTQKMLIQDGSTGDDV